MKQLSEANIKFFTKLLTDETCGRGVDGEFRKELKKVDLTLVLPVGHHALNLAGDLLCMAPHELVS
ncbi:unannotated protein [freshwater metagenome]|uniref:Unannotated protein n=1 Tax=freshwater metagenome TaxID=449393 RepID=A0A6J7I3I2_9ZZZZ